MDKKEGFKRMKETSRGKSVGADRTSSRGSGSERTGSRGAGFEGRSSRGAGFEGTSSRGAGSERTNSRGAGFEKKSSRGVGFERAGNKGFSGEGKSRGAAGAGTSRPGTGGMGTGRPGTGGMGTGRPRVGGAGTDRSGSGRPGIGSKPGSGWSGTGRPGTDGKPGSGRSGPGRPTGDRTRSIRFSKGERPLWDKPSRERSLKGRPVRKRIEDNLRDDADEAGILEGRNPVMEALKSGRSINRLIISSGDREGSIGKIISMGRERGIVIQEVEKSRLDFLSVTGAHQGVIAYVSPKDYVEVSAILEKAREKGEDPFIIILDGVTDPHNLGSTIRTADAVGAHGIIIPKRRAVALNATVAKASAGALEYVDVARVTNISQAIEELKANNIWVVGTDSEAAVTFDEVDFKRPIALVIGGEGEGIGRLVKEKCDYVVNIPMKGGVSSLNASVAAAIMMYEVHRQRNR